MTTLPNFLIIGAQKAGTTSLHRYLREHPEIFMSKPKELYFFTEEHNWHRGREWYEQQFRGAGNAKAIGEASVAYTMYPTYRGVPARIASLLPDARLIYLVRNPIDRMCSDYLQYRYPKARRRIRWDVERHRIEQALLHNPRYLDYSLYAMQIDRYMEHFPREQLLVVVSDELRDARETTLRRIYEFLGVNNDWAATTSSLEFNRTRGKRRPRGMASRAIRRVPGAPALARWTPKPVRRAAHNLTTLELDPSRATISEDVRHRLEGMLRDDVSRLRTYLGDDFDGWGLG